MQRCRGAELQRCRDAEMQSFRDAEMQKRRDAEMQRRRNAEMQKRTMRRARWQCHLAAATRTFHLKSALSCLMKLTKCSCIVSLLRIFEGGFHGGGFDGGGFNRGGFDGRVNEGLDN